MISAQSGSKISMISSRDFSKRSMGWTRGQTSTAGELPRSMLLWSASTVTTSRSGTLIRNLRREPSLTSSISETSTLGISEQSIRRRISPLQSPSAYPMQLEDQRLLLYLKRAVFMKATERSIAPDVGRHVSFPLCGVSLYHNSLFYISIHKWSLSCLS